jgi:hypothetical protein
MSFKDIINWLLLEIHDLDSILSTKWSFSKLSRRVGFVSRKGLKKAEIRNKKWIDHFKVTFVIGLK